MSKFTNLFDHINPVKLIKNKVAEKTGKVMAKKLKPDLKNNLLKGLLSGGKHDIDSFTISIKDIPSEGVFLSTLFLENMISLFLLMRKIH